jgi:hypothetical protein
MLGLGFLSARPAIVRGMAAASAFVIICLGVVEAAPLAAPLATKVCSSVSFCQIYENKGSGGGVAGEGGKGFGVEGTSVSGDGVVGTTDSGNAAGVAGYNTGGAGLYGSSTGYGVFGTSSGNDGVHGTSSATGFSAVAGEQTGNGYGVYAESADTTGNYGAVGINATASETNLINASNSSTGASFVVKANGNAYVSGLVYTSGQCSSGCSKHRHVRLYTAQQSIPTVEDFGVGELRDGESYVRFDPAFANVMDGSVGYMVLVTPEGDNRGLFVTHKSPEGFEVRESEHGRSSLYFDYRIVAWRYGERVARLPFVDSYGRVTR